MHTECKYISDWAEGMKRMLAASDRVYVRKKTVSLLNTYRYGLRQRKTKLNTRHSEVRKPQRMHELKQVAKIIVLTRCIAAEHCYSVAFARWRSHVLLGPQTASRSVEPFLQGSQSHTDHATSRHARE